MIALMKNYGEFLERCPHGPSLLLILIYLNDNGLSSRKKDLSKAISSSKVLDDILTYLQSNNIINPIIHNNEIHYIVNRSTEVLPLSLSPADKFKILAALKELFPADERFNTEVAYLEKLIRQHKLFDLEKILAVLKGLVGTGLTSLQKVSRKDVDIILSSAEEAQASLESDATETEKKLARMMYVQMTDRRYKDRLLRLGVRTSNLDEQLQKTGDEYRLESVIVELKSMPVKFKFVE